MGVVDSVIYGRVRVIRLAGRGANAMTIDMAQTLLGLCQETAGRDDIGAVVITGGFGSAFCAGSDLRELQRLQEDGQGPGPLLCAEAEAFEALAALPQPVVAAVEGPAMGGGLEMLLSADLIIASETARFALPEVKVGVFPALGGTTRLAQRIGVGRAREMLLLGDEIDAETALSWGLVTRVTRPHMAYLAARRLSKRLAMGPQTALAALKQSLRDVEAMSILEAQRRALQSAIAHAKSTDAEEGLRAFSARETPDFLAARKR